MRVILSRKGFDSSNGGYPSPILPDGTLLSIPIPSSDEEEYGELLYEGIQYSSILEQLTGSGEFFDKHCHLDPDIREGVRKVEPSNWSAAFGQFGSAQGILRNREVGTGDLFLFFGWFRETEGDFKEGTLRYKSNAPDLNVIFGYLQVGEMINDPEILEKKYAFHPHSSEERRNSLGNDGTSKNMLYLPSDKLSFDSSKKGYGVFEYSEDLVLTQPNQPSRTLWKEIAALAPGSFDGNAKNCSKGEGYQYGGIWQEKVSLPDNETVEWAKGLIKTNIIGA